MIFRHVPSLVNWELRMAFRRPATYALLGALGLIAAASFSWLVTLLARGGGLTLHFGDDPAVQFLGPNVFLAGAVTVLVPLLTMSVFAEGRHQGTGDVWRTTRVGPVEWIVARGLTAWLVLQLCLAPWLIYAVTLRGWSGQADSGVILSAWLGLSLLSASLLAVGLLASAVCRSTLAAACSTLVVLLLMLGASAVVKACEQSGVDAWLLQILNAVAVWQHQEGFSQGRVVPAIIAGHLTAVVVCCGGALWLTERPRSTRSVAAGVIAATLLVSLNLGIHLLPDIDLTSRRLHTLAPQTQALLRRLTQPLSITIIARREAQTAEDQRFAPARRLVRELADACRQVSPQMRFEELTPADPTAGERSGGTQEPCMVVSIEDGRQTRRTVLTARDLLSWRTSGRTVESVPFHGEQALAAALARLTSGEGRSLVGVTTGHGELSFESVGLVMPASATAQSLSSSTSQETHATGNASRSMSLAIQRLEELDCEIRPLDLRRSRIPPETVALLIAGSREPWSPEELERLRAWLLNGGRALVLLEPIRDPVTRQPSFSGLEPLLREFGVTVEPTPARGGVSGSPVRSGHGLAKSLAESPVAFWQPLALRPARGTASATLVPLLRPDTSQGDGLLAVAVEQREVPRLVVVGDSDFLSDEAATSAKGRAGFVFGLAAIHWLQDRRELLGDIPPRIHEPYRLPGTDADHRRLVLIPLFAMLTLTLTFGLVAWMRRA